jgi:hypothetical protein
MFLRPLIGNFEIALLHSVFSKILRFLLRQGFFFFEILRQGFSGPNNL